VSNPFEERKYDIQQLIKKLANIEIDIETEKTKSLNINRFSQIVSLVNPFVDRQNITSAKYIPEQLIWL
jgi:hypothetical protein